MIRRFRSGRRPRAARAQVQSLETRRLLSGLPFHGIPFKDGQRIEAEDFDLGGAGVAYHDTTAANLGNSSYRPGEGVDLRTGGTDVAVSSTAAGEWLQYTVLLPANASYTVQARYALPSPGARFHISFDGQVSSSVYVLPQTRGWENWQTFSTAPLALSAGVHVMRVSLDANSNRLKSVGDFDWFGITEEAGPASFNWASGSLSPARRFEGYGRVVNGKLYAFGGYSSITPFSVDNTADVYDPATNHWTYLGTIPVPQTHSGIAVDDSTGSIYFVGGLRGNYPGVATSDVYRYDTAANKWTQLPSLPQPMGAGNAQIVDGELHYFGGIGADSRDIDFSTHYVISLSDLNSGNSNVSWATAADMPTPRDHFTSAVVNGKIYVMGGEVGHDLLHQQQVETDAYDPATDTWTRLADMPIPKSHDESGTFVVDGKIVVAGGQVDDYLSTSNVSEYDPATNRWFILPSLPNTLAGTIVQKIGSKLFVISGYDGVSGIATQQAWTGTWAASAPPPPVVKPPVVIPPVITPPVTKPTSSTPLRWSPFTAGQTIQAEDFDNGGEGVAYHDFDASNRGGAYRNTAVDIERGGTGYDVGWVGAGEWLSYTVTIAKAGNYRLQASVANTMSGGSFHAEFAGTNKTGAMAIPNTRGWNKFQTTTSQTFALSAGTYVMRIYMDEAAANMAVGNFDWFKIIAG